MWLWKFGKRSNNYSSNCPYTSTHNFPNRSYKSTHHTADRSNLSYKSPHHIANRSYLPHKGPHYIANSSNLSSNDITHRAYYNNH